MLMCYARELKEGFAAYTEEVVKIMVSHLKFYFHDGAWRCFIALVCCYQNYSVIKTYFRGAHKLHVDQACLADLVCWHVARRALGCRGESTLPTGLRAHPRARVPAEHVALHAAAAAAEHRVRARE